MRLAKETWSYYPPKIHEPTGLKFELCIKHGSIEIGRGCSIEKNKYGQITKITPHEMFGILS